MVGESRWEVFAVVFWILGRMFKLDDGCGLDFSGISI